MAGFGVLAFRLIDGLDENRAEAQARAYAKTIRADYRAAQRAATPAARRIVRDPALQEATRRGDVAAVRDRAASLARREGLARLSVTTRGRTLADVGATGAVAPARQGLRFGGGPPAVVAASVTPARRLSDALRGTGAGMTVTRSGRPLAGRPPAGESLARTNFTGPDFGARRLQAAIRVPEDRGAGGSVPAALVVSLL